MTTENLIGRSGTWFAERDRAIAESAWDQGWHEHYLEMARQKADPSHPITKVNPFRSVPKENT